MKNNLKKLSCLLIALMLVFSFAACSGDSGSDSDATAVQEYVDTYGNAFITSFEESFDESSGMDSTCTITAEGTKIVIQCNVAGLNDIDAETKDMLQSTYDGMKDQLTETFKPIKEELPELTGAVMKICEEDGDVLAEVDMAL